MEWSHAFHPDGCRSAIINRWCWTSTSILRSMKSSEEIAPVEHKRSDRRYERNVPIDFTYQGSSFSGRTRNISLGGVFIETEERLPFGARVTLSFRVPTQAEAINVDGQVRWLEIDDGRLRGIGVRFDGLRARDVWALNKFFEQPIDK
jgi:uncharacterized protein (TIGR02266 family)